MENLIGLIIFAVIAGISALVKLNEKRKNNVMADRDMGETIARPDEDHSA